MARWLEHITEAATPNVPHGPQFSDMRHMLDSNTSDYCDTRPVCLNSITEVMATMSLAIDITVISEVLIANEWISVQPGTFRLDKYEFVQEGTTAKVQPGTGNSMTALGFTFRSGSANYAGPMASIRAIKFAD
jgi:hypothetical protein